MKIFKITIVTLCVALTGASVFFACKKENVKENVKENQITKIINDNSIQKEVDILSDEYIQQLSAQVGIDLYTMSEETYFDEYNQVLTDYNSRMNDLTGVQLDSLSLLISLMNEALSNNDNELAYAYYDQYLTIYDGSYIQGTIIQDPLANTILTDMSASSNNFFSQINCDYPEFQNLSPEMQSDVITVSLAMAMYEFEDDNNKITAAYCRNQKLIDQKAAGTQYGISIFACGVFSPIVIVAAGCLVVASATYAVQMNHASESYELCMSQIQN